MESSLTSICSMDIQVSSLQRQIGVGLINSNPWLLCGPNGRGIYYLSQPKELLVKTVGSLNLINFKTLWAHGQSSTANIGPSCLTQANKSFSIICQTQHFYVPE